MQDTMSSASVFISHDQDRLIELDVVTEVFNATLKMIDIRRPPSGQRFSIDSTIVRVGASFKKLRRKGGSSWGRPSECWRCQLCIDNTYEASINPESGLYCRSNAAPALSSFVSQFLWINRHGQADNSKTGISDSKAALDVAEHIRAGMTSAVVVSEISQRKKIH